MAEPLVWLADVLKKADVRVKEHEGWKTRATEGTEPKPVGVLEHHTASKASADNPAPTLETVIEGRSDLDGPLCHGLIGYDGTVHLIAAGRANHAGKAKKSGPVEAGDGNTLYVGFEWDYDGEHKPSRKQYQAGVRATAAVLNKLDESAKAARGHKETSTEGKIDPGHVDLDEFRADVAEAMKKLSRGGDDDKSGDGGKPGDGRSGDGDSGDGHDGRKPGDGGRSGGSHGNDDDGDKHKKLPKPGDGPKPRKKMGPPDPDVYHTIFLVGKDMKVPDKVMLAAFETGLVESHMSNLNWGDADSVGAFQQRPSQGWGSQRQCMNVNHAAREFFERAVAAYKENHHRSAGRLAQAVQQSAKPDSYDEEEDNARKYLKRTKEHYGVDGDDESRRKSEDSDKKRTEDQGARDRSEKDGKGGKGAESAPAGADRPGRQRGAEDRDREPEGRRPEDGHGPTERRREEESAERDRDDRERRERGRDESGESDEDRRHRERGAHDEEHPGRDRDERGEDGDSRGRDQDRDRGRDARERDGDREQDREQDKERRELASYSSWVVPGRNGSLAAFARAASGDLVTAWQVGPKDDWVGWLGVGGDSEGLPVAARDHDGVVSVFARRDDGLVETSTRNGSARWSKWRSIRGKVASRPVALVLRNGAMMLFAVGNDGKLCTATQAGPRGHWGRWNPVSGQLRGQPTVVARPDGSIVVFARSEDDEVCMATQKTAGDEWSKWTVLGGRMASSPLAVTMPGGELLLIGVGNNGHLYTTTKIKEDTDWEPTGAHLEGMPAIATAKDGTVSAFARDEENVVWTAQRGAKGDWSDWNRIGGHVAGDPIAVTDDDGEVTLFAIGRDGDMYTTSRADAEQEWKPWHELVDSLRPSGEAPDAKRR